MLGEGSGDIVVMCVVLDLSGDKGVGESKKGGDKGEEGDKEERAHLVLKERMQQVHLQQATLLTCWLHFWM